MRSFGQSERPSFSYPAGRALDGGTGFRAHRLRYFHLVLYGVVRIAPSTAFPKRGLSMSVALWAARLAEQGIPVFEVRPGIIRTDMIAKVEACLRRKDRWRPASAAPYGRAARYRRLHPRHRCTACWIIPPGRSLNVDGGFHFGRCNRSAVLF